MAYQTSQGLASLGRNGDSVLVHMNPTEVAGLQSLAMSQGGSLTINPHTGLPEAFNLGGFFKSLLPVFAGAMTGGAGMPLWAGIAAGAATGAATSKDPLMGALTGGLGGYGGFGLGQGLFAAGAPAAIPGSAATPGIVGSTGEIGSNLLTASRGIAPGAASATANAAGNVYNLADTAVNTSGLAAGNVNPALANLKNVANTSGFTASAGTGASGVDKSFLGGMDRLGPGASQMGTGIKNIATSQPGAWDAFKASFVEPGAKPISDLAAYGKIGMPVGGAVLGGLEPSDIYGEPINMDEAKKKQAYNPNATLNLSGDTGLRLYAEGGTIATGGIRDLYGSSDNQNQAPLSRDGYGLGRLNQLGNQQSLSQAQTLGYADGGDVVAGEKGMNLDELPSLNVNTGEQGYGGKSYYMTPDGSGMYAGRFFKDVYRQNPDAPPLFRLFSRLPNDMVWNKKMAQGGPVSFADGGDSNKEDALGLPSLSPDMAMDPNAGAGNSAMIQSAMGAMQPMQGMQGSTTAQGQMPDQSNDSLIAKVTANLRADPNYQPTNPIEASIVKQIKGTDPMQQGQPSQQGLGALTPSQPMAPSYAPSVAMGPTYFAGMNAPRGYAEGGDVGGGVPAGGADESAPNPEGIVSKYTTGVDDKGIASRVRVPYQYEKIIIPGVQDFDTIPRIEYNPYTYAGAMRKQQGMARGGYLDGAGDGMSDSIPATIEGKQPARLADGEFVVPADVVSHIGNGSSKAGSKRLYAMLDKVRKARTGHTKQGKQIKPEKYMPA